MHVLTLVSLMTLLGQGRQWGEVSRGVVIDDKRVSESSGVAPSWLRPGHYYTHNDSGDSARFFEFDLKGKVIREVSVTNAKAVDWEDMASARIGAKAYLFFGDIGDNSEKRIAITIYRVPEGNSPSVTADAVFTLTYPDGPHNAETLMVHPRTGDIYIVTKTSEGPSLIFRLAAPRKSGSYVLKKVGSLQIQSLIKQGKLVTGGAISPDAKHVMLRTYLGIFEFDVNGSFDSWMKARSRPVQSGFSGQAESVCYSVDGKMVLSTAEGTPCSLFMGWLKKF